MPQNTRRFPDRILVGTLCFLAAAFLLPTSRSSANDSVPSRSRQIASVSETTNSEDDHAFSPIAEDIAGAPEKIARVEDCCSEPLPSPPPSPYKGVFYTNDFSYLDDPYYRSDDLFDALKRIRFSDDFLLDFGGEYRLRLHDENNTRANGLDEEFVLHRTRFYTDIWYRKKLRAYAEFIDAANFHEDLPTRPIYVNRADFINLFGEAVLLQDADGLLSARVGRQELIYGSQRLISPLDWANTRRTFDGAKLFWKGGDWSVDGFWTRPVPFGQHVPDDHNFDHPDESQQFYGLFSTYKGWEGHTFDFYYLGFEESNASGTGIQFDAHTVGGRWDGSYCDWLWEFEGGYQFGNFAALDQSAGFYTVGTGRRFFELPWSPTVWAYFDWASGDSNPTDGKRGTFNQLFPFGHYYMGFIDLVGRQNIEDVNFKLSLKPHAKASILLWWHIYHLEEARDSLYNAGGGVARTDPTGASGTDVGNELDVLIKLQLDRHADILFGYSRLFAGEFIKNTGIGQDADFYYTQFSYKF